MAVYKQNEPLLRDRMCCYQKGKWGYSEKASNTPLKLLHFLTVQASCFEKPR